MDPSPFLYIIIVVYHLLVLFTFLQTTIFYHSIRLILCLQQTGEIDNLTVSWDNDEVQPRQCPCLWAFET
jgi:hypothetical protein